MLCPLSIKFYISSAVVRLAYIMLICQFSEYFQPQNQKYSTLKTNFGFETFLQIVITELVHFKIFGV